MLLVSVFCLVPAASPTGDDETWVDPALRDPGPGEVSVIASFQAAPTEQHLDAVTDLGTVHHVYSIIDAVHVTIPAHRIAALADVPGVTRLDADAPLERHLETSRPAIQVGPRLWGQGYRGADTTVAVVDTGVDGTHPTFDGKLHRSVTFTGGEAGPVEAPTGSDDDGHGTHVAGIVAGTGSSSSLTDPSDDGYAGIAPDTSLVSLDISASFTTSTAIRAFEWIHENHDAYDITVVQNSWGRKDTSERYDPRDPAVRASNALVFDDDLLVVFSAANEGPNEQTLSMEAMNPNVLTVGATDDTGKVATFSSRGPVVFRNGTVAPWVKPDVSAPGVRIHSAASSQDASATDLYKDLSGTSQAAPHVAGVAALIRAEAPNLPATAVMDALRETAIDLNDPGPDPHTGHGMVDTPAALERALELDNGTLTTSTETYTDRGRIVAGTQSSLSELMPEDSGVDSHRANGSFPVDPGAERLAFRFTWSSTTELPAPALSVTLTDPTGRDVLVPIDDQTATRELASPVDGRWSWNAEPVSPTTAGAADYEMNATVTTTTRSTLSETGSDQGGFFEDSYRARAERALTELQGAIGEGPFYAVLAGLAVIVLASVVAVARRVRGG